MLAGIFKKEVAGVYFGSKSLALAQQSNGKIKNYLRLPYPREDENAAGDDIFDFFQDKEMELLAFLQKALRDSKIDATQLIVSLPPKDLIIRFFEMPNIPRSEIMAGINFEVKKYVPFKIEELAFDFQYRVKQKANIIEVVLCGMKQAPLERYINLLQHLNLDVLSYEPGLFSLFRLLTIKNKIISQKSYIILEFDKEGANILIAEKGFPYFTRDIKLTPVSGEMKAPEDFDAVLFRLINEVRVSLDYYRRQFLKKDVDEMFIISSKVSSGWIDNFSRELGLKVSFLDLGELLQVKDIPDEHFSDLGKSFGACLKADKPLLITLNLARSREKPQSAAASFIGSTRVNMEQMILDFLSESKAALVKGGIAGLIILAIAYGMGFSKVFPLEKELAVASVQQPPLLPGIDVSSLEGLQVSETQLLEKQRVFRKFVEGYTPFYKTLKGLSKLIPRGVWLTSMYFTTEPNQLLMSCSSYAENDKERSGQMNVFIQNLTKDSEFAKEFSSIELKSWKETKSEDEYYHLRFEVVCSK
jgi:hypothetical protein